MPTYDVLGYAFEAQIEHPAARDLFERLYGRFARSGCVGRERFSLARLDASACAGWVIGHNDDERIAEPTLGGALRRLEFEICRRVVDRRNDLIVLHGALALRDAFAALIVGRSGAGKTTLALALTARGFHIPTDDIVFLDPVHNALLPLPRCFHLDADAYRLLDRAGVSLAGVARAHNFVAPAPSAGDGIVGGPLAAVIVLDATAATAPRPLSQAETALRLLDEAGWQTADAAPLAPLASLLAATRCLALPRRPLVEMVDAVCALAEADRLPSATT